jgi:integrase/recombinase XerD
MHAERGFFRFAHIDGLIVADPAVYARLPKGHSDESRTQGLDRLELIRFLQVAQTITVHHGALAYLLGINALRASEAAAVRIEDYRETLRGHRVLHLAGKGQQAGHHAPNRSGPPRPRGLPGRTNRWTPGSAPPDGQSDRQTRRLPHGSENRQGRKHPASHQPSFATARGTNALDAGLPLPDVQILARHADLCTTEHYDRARGNLDRHGVHFLTAYVAGV